MSDPKDEKERIVMSNRPATTSESVRRLRELSKVALDLRKDSDALAGGSAALRRWVAANPTLRGCKRKHVERALEILRMAERSLDGQVSYLNRESVAQRERGRR